jgi:transposase
MRDATVLTGVERRRRWSLAEKRELVAESVSCGLSVSEFARRHDLHPNLLHSWRRQAKSGALSRLPEGGACLVPVKLAAASAAPGPMEDAASGAVIEVVLRNGRRLSVPARAAPQRVAQLADALEGSAQ